LPIDMTTMNRRQFLKTTAVGAAAVAIAPGCITQQTTSSETAAAGRGVKWPVGCFNRPWVKWSYDVALDGDKAAGYNLTGLLTVQKPETFIAAESTPEYLKELKKRITSRGLAVNMGAIRAKFTGPVEDGIKDLRAQVDNAARLELKYMLTFGAAKETEYENFYRIMADASKYAEPNGIHIVMKPHGGGSGASEEILRCIEKVNHSNFKIWYDAGNIIYYTGKDPLAELEPVAKYVTGFCAKDCPEMKGEVMSQFGTGKVDFKAVFKRLKAAGFNGPIMVEGVKVGATPEESTANAKANREFLEKVLATI
jgi:sugar phosphate isomerase/epimerase